MDPAHGARRSGNAHPDRAQPPAVIACRRNSRRGTAGPLRKPGSRCRRKRPVPLCRRMLVGAPRRGRMPEAWLEGRGVIGNPGRFGGSPRFSGVDSALSDHAAARKGGGFFAQHAQRRLFGVGVPGLSGTPPPPGLPKSGNTSSRLRSEGKPCFGALIRSSQRPQIARHGEAVPTLVVVGRSERGVGHRSGCTRGPPVSRLPEYGQKTYKDKWVTDSGKQLSGAVQHIPGCG